MLEPLGQSQVLAYLKPLSSDRVIHLISFEKAEDWSNLAERMRITKEVADSGILWHPLRYHKHPSVLATAWDIACGTVLGLWLILRFQLQMVHARSYVPSVIALVIKWLTGAKYLFDMRGFWVDERVDGGMWQRKSNIFRIAKFFEQRFLISADHVISLTQAAVNEIERFPYLQGRMPQITVIPTCADLNLFAPGPANNSGRGFVLGYVGSAGTWYLFDEVITTFRQLLRMRPDAYFLVVNRGEHDYIKERLVAGGIPNANVEVITAKHREVPAQIARMNAGVFFIKPVFSKQASAPTKLAEFLGCGVPCLSNVGVGDMAEILEDEKVGVALTTFESTTRAIALSRLIELAEDSHTRERCVSVARSRFSLDAGVYRYSMAYQKIADEK